MKLTLEYICITQLQISGERVVFNTVTNIYQRDTSQLQIIPQHFLKEIDNGPVILKLRVIQ